MTSTDDSASRASFLQRLVWLSLACSSATTLAVAATLEPNLNGYGTHTQLGLPPCGFLLLTGSPCPGCGLTTAFAHAVRGSWGLAMSANPLGLALFFLACCCVPLGVLAALRAWSFDSIVERFALARWALAIAGCAVMLWVVRFAAVF